MFKINKQFMKDNQWEKIIQIRHENDLCFRLKFI